MDGISKIILIAAAIIPLSCSRQELMVQKPVPAQQTYISMKCPAEDGKTSLDRLSPKWSAGDRIWIGDGENSCLSVVPDIYGGSSTVSLPVSGIETDDAVYALYPYDEKAGVDDDDRIAICIPPVQDGSFAKANIMVGMSEDCDVEPVQMRLASALLKFTVGDGGIDAFQMHTPGAAVSGTFLANAADGISSDILNGLQDILLDPCVGPDGGTGYIGVNPVTLPAGTRFTFLKGDCIGYAVTTKPNTLARGTITDMGSIDNVAQFEGGPAVDLSQEESANCYVVSNPGCYCFKAVRGNSSEIITGACLTEVLWESAGVSDAPRRYSLVSDVICHDSRVYFRVPQGAPDGNALIAVKDAGGKILWSWHIWLLSSGVSDQMYSGDGLNGSVVMDRNLGALSAARGDAVALGLLYQWGRKDPFPGIISSRMSAPVGVAGAPVTTVSYDRISDRVAYSVSHPTEFICGNPDSWSGTTEMLWSCDASSKTVWDPCPAGYQTTGASAFSGLGKSETAWDPSGRGRYFVAGGASVWYPCAGSIGAEDGSHYSGTTGYYWLGKGRASSDNALKISGSSFDAVSVGQSGGYSVRCSRFSGTPLRKAVLVVFSTDDGNMSFPYVKVGENDDAAITWKTGNSQMITGTFINFSYPVKGSYNVRIDAESLDRFELKSLRGISEIDRSGM